MLTTRWGPFVHVNRLSHEMDRLFDHLSATRPQRYSAATFPPLNMWEDENNMYVEAELPGFELNDLEIFVTAGNQLSFKGERKAPELEGGTWHQRERGFGQFGRSIELPGYVDSANVSAEFRAGVLTVTLPKREEVKPRKIEVKVS